MSRVGKVPIPIPKGTKVEIKDGIFVAEGPKGKVSQPLLQECPVTIEDGLVRHAGHGLGLVFPRVFFVVFSGAPPPSGAGEAGLQTGWAERAARFSGVVGRARSRSSKSSRFQTSM